MPETFSPVDPSFSQARETWIVFDTAKIFKGATRPPAEFDSFTTLALQESIQFISARTASDVGKAYCNITSRDSLQKPFWLESMGIRFHYPNPVRLRGTGVADIAAAKLFMEELPNHCYLTFQTEEDVRAWLKPIMAPPGYGNYGSYQLGVAAGTAFCQGVETSGMPLAQNRFVFLGGLEIPSSTKITIQLYFSDHGKAILNKLADVPGYDFT